MLIGVVDSGIGGLNIYYPLKKSLKKANFIYYKDSKNLPYGSKSNKEMISIAKNIAYYFKNINIDILVIACNTLSVFKYVFESILNIKIFDMISINTLYLKRFNIDEFILLATPLTIKSKIYKSFFNKNNIKFKELALNNWAKLIENRKIKEIKRDLILINLIKYDKILIGCTHYLTIITLIKKYCPNKKIINSTNFLLNELKKYVDISK